MAGTAYLGTPAVELNFAYASCIDFFNFTYPEIRTASDATWYVAMDFALSDAPRSASPSLYRCFGYPDGICF